MLESLRLIYQRLIQETQTEHYRFLYYSIDLNNRLIGLVGPRGVGKTTLLLQLIKNHFRDKSKVFYFSADHIYFEQISIYKFVENLYLTEDIHTFYIDEIHKYANWNQELKNLYDGFPKMKIIFSGSSSLNLIKGSYDLSRRGKMYFLPGMSFREYYNFNNNTNIAAIPYKELISSYKSLDKSLANLPKVKGEFKAYIAQGFYPFYFENPLSYYERILNIIDKTIYEDVANFYDLKTANLHIFKKILVFLASIPPGQTSVHNIAKNLSVDDKTILHYLDILQNVGLVLMVYPAEAGNLGMRRPEKIFLNNTNLLYAINGNLASDLNIGTVRELFFIQALKNAGINVFHSKNGDFSIDKNIFEVGGKNKTKKQIKAIDHSYLVKDDIMISRTREIPLMYFGFLY